MEDVKEELRALKEGGRGDLTEEQYEQKQQMLLMQWYRTTGPAKLEAGIRHIENLIEQGDPPVLHFVGLARRVYLHGDLLGKHLLHHMLQEFFCHYTLSTFNAFSRSSVVNGCLSPLPEAYASLLD